MKQKEEIADTGCCPRFNPEPWDKKEFNWNNKHFVKDHVKSIFHIPINFGQVMTRNVEKIQKSHQKVNDDVVLTDEKSLWGSDVFFSVNEDVPNADNVTLSGTFLSKVFEGPYKDAGKWIEEMKHYVESKGKNSDKIYNWYTTCPKCAKAYGKNYTVLFAKVD